MNKEKFLEAYTNLPETEKNQIIVIIDDEGLSWDDAYKTIMENSELGEKILKKLEAMGIL